MILTPMLMEIVDALTCRVNQMSVEQIEAAWCPRTMSQKAFRRELKQLLDTGLVMRTTTVAHPRLAIESPLVAWSPNDDEPDFESVAHVIRARWRQPDCLIEVYWASAKAANRFGSAGGRRPNVTHLDHDLLLSDVYVYYRTRHPDLAKCWIGENAIPKAGYRTKDPDAFLLDGSGIPVRVIESSGRYGIRQIQSFHNHCVDHDLPYELW